MSLRRNNKPSPPEVMTWAKALPILAIGFVFDALRFLFEQFWFFGPALAAAYCAAKTSDVAIIGGLLEKACVAGAATLGYFSGPELTVFGFVMAMAIGLLGWLTVGLALRMTNARIFKEHPGHFLWFIFSFGIAETPIIGAFPAFTSIILKMYYAQIKKDKESLRKYANENAAAQLQERRQRAAEHMQEAPAVKANEAAMLNETRYAETENEDHEEIPDEMREAA